MSCNLGPTMSHQHCLYCWTTQAESVGFRITHSGHWGGMPYLAIRAPVPGASCLVCLVSVYRLEALPCRFESENTKLWLHLLPPDPTRPQPGPVRLNITPKQERANRGSITHPKLGLYLTSQHACSPKVQDLDRIFLENKST